MIVNISDTQHAVVLSHPEIKALTEAVILEEGKSYDEVNLYFVDTPKICSLHAEYFDDPSPTDCISFPMDEDEEDGIFPLRILGDLFICPSTALSYASENQVNLHEEISLYIVHGLLHLMGYDDINDQEIAIMRAAEKRHMQNLKAGNLLLNPL